LLALSPQYENDLEKIILTLLRTSAYLLLKIIRSRHFVLAEGQEKLEVQ
jgi:hypothetical protein